MGEAEGRVRRLSAAHFFHPLASSHHRQRKCYPVGLGMSSRNSSSMQVGKDKITQSISDLQMTLSLGWGLVG